MNTRDYLFTKGDLSATLDNVREKLRKEIGMLTSSQVEHGNREQVCAHFVSEYQIPNILLHEEALEVLEPREVEVQIQNRDFGRTYTAKKLEFKFELPFEGHGELLFHCKPSSYDFNPPQGKVHGNIVTLTIIASANEADGVKRTIAEWKQTLNRYISWQQSDVNAWNTQLPGLVRQLVEARRQKHEADRKLVVDIGVPVRRRGDPPAAYVFPLKQKQIAPKLPASKSGAIRKPEPVLDMAIYEEILDTLASMSVTMERCPSSFVGMKEEDLRMQFLIPLNSKFAGETSGETFNAAGKTDILIKQDDRIVFVAECKFWKGPKSLKDAIDQLLSYLTWRETKAAILLFNRNQNFSTVLSQIPEVFLTHPQLIRMETYKSETGFRFIVRHPNDSERHLIVTILAFDIPTTVQADQP